MSFRVPTLAITVFPPLPVEAFYTHLDAYFDGHTLSHWFHRAVIIQDACRLLGLIQQGELISRCAPQAIVDSTCKLRHEDECKPCRLHQRFLFEAPLALRKDFSPMTHRPVQWPKTDLFSLPCPLIMWCGCNHICLSPCLPANNVVWLQPHLPVCEVTRGHVTVD